MIRKSLLFLLSLALISSCQSKKGKWSDTEFGIPDSIEVAADLQQQEQVSVLIPEYPPADGKPPAWVCWSATDREP